ncbi:PqqD family protein [Streptomyces tubercidicus]|uniref:PqqD family protein n=1 Tax=Streptomyces tubercidicus TaxID=47759 RepID=UPI00379DC620
MLTPSGVHAAHIGHGITAVLAVRTGSWVWLDEVSVRIWQAALAGTVSELEDELVAQGYAREQVREAVEASMGTLRAHRLVEDTMAARRTRRSRRGRRAVVA